jgi:hypothetical protein
LPFWNIGRRSSVAAFSHRDAKRTHSSTRNSPWERTAAKKLAAEYFERFPKDQTEVQSQNIEFTMKRLPKPIERATEIAK